MDSSFAEVFRNSLYGLVDKTMAVVPDITVAIVILLVGLIVSPVFGGIVKKIIDMFKVDVVAEKIGLHEFIKPFFPKPSISVFVGKIVKWFFILAFLIMAMDVLKWQKATEILNEIWLYIPNVFLAVLILTVGTIAGKFIEDFIVRVIKGSQTPIANPELLGRIAKYALVTFVTLAALMQLKIAADLIEILFTGVVFALALAFGLGGREKAAKILDYFDHSK